MTVARDVALCLGASGELSLRFLWFKADHSLLTPAKGWPLRMCSCEKRRSKKRARGRRHWQGRELANLNRCAPAYREIASAVDGY